MCITCGCSVFGGKYKSMKPHIFVLPVSSNHLDTSSAWKPLVASCVGLKFEREFSMHSFPAPKVLVSSTINTFVFHLEVGLETPKKEQKIGGGVFLQCTKFHHVK